MDSSLRKHAMQFAVSFKGCKNDNFWMKHFDIFFIFALKHNCDYFRV